MDIYIYTHLYLYIYIHIVIKLKYRNKNMGLKPCYTHKSHTNSQAFSLISSPQSQVPQSPGARLGQRHGASPHQPMQHIWKSIDVHFIYIYIHTSYHISHISLYIYNYIYKEYMYIQWITMIWIGIISLCSLLYARLRYIVPLGLIQKRCSD